MKNIKKRKQKIIKTKNGKLSAEVKKKNIFGCMKGTAIIRGDITKAIDIKWEVLKDDK